MKKTPIMVTLILFAVFLAYTCACIMLDVSTVEPRIVFESEADSFGYTDVGFSTINQKVNSALGFHETFYKISEYLGYAAILTGFAIGCLWLYELVKKRSLLKIDAALSAAVLAMALMAVFYVLFELVELNYRPVVLSEEGLEASYPSSHTLLGLTVFGCAGMVSAELLSEKAIARSVKWLFYVLGIVLMLFRALSGVHWLSDIVGGIILAAALNSFARYAKIFITEIPKECP